MTATLKIYKPEAVELELSCRATVETWTEIAAALKRARDNGDLRIPANIILRSIEDAVYEANKHFYGEAEG